MTTTERARFKNLIKKKTKEELQDMWRAYLDTNTRLTQQVKDDDQEKAKIIDHHLTK